MIIVLPNAAGNVFVKIPGRGGGVKSEINFAGFFLLSLFYKIIIFKNPLISATRIQ